jgi:hypothetical protein
MLGVDAEEGREAVGESLMPVGVERRNGIRDRIFSDGSDDLIAWKQCHGETK